MSPQFSAADIEQLIRKSDLDAIVRKVVLDDEEKTRRRAEKKLDFEMNGRGRPGESRLNRNTPDFEWNGNEEI